MSESRRRFEASDICGNRIEIQNPKPVGSAASVKVHVKPAVSWLDCKHKEDAIDRLVKEYGQGTGYSQWQKEHYPVKVERHVCRY